MKYRGIARVIGRVDCCGQSVNANGKKGLVDDATDYSQDIDNLRQPNYRIYFMQFHTAKREMRRGEERKGEEKRREGSGGKDD